MLANAPSSAVPKQPRPVPVAEVFAQEGWKLSGVIAREARAGKRVWRFSPALGLSVAATLILMIPAFWPSYSGSALIAQRSESLRQEMPLLAALVPEFEQLTTSWPIPAGEVLALRDEAGRVLSQIEGPPLPAGPSAAFGDTLLLDLADGLKQTLFAAPATGEDGSTALLTGLMMRMGQGQRGPLVASSLEPDGRLLFATFMALPEGDHPAAYLSRVSHAGGIDLALRLERERQWRWIGLALLAGLGLWLVLHGWSGRRERVEKTPISEPAPVVADLPAAQVQPKAPLQSAPQTTVPPQAAPLSAAAPQPARAPDLENERAAWLSAWSKLPAPAAAPAAAEVAQSAEAAKTLTSLQLMVTALQERLRANEQFAADLTHEIRSPLASLGAAFDNLDAARGKQRTQLLGMIRQDIGRLDRLVSDISNAARLERDLVGAREQQIDLGPFLLRLGRYFHRQAAQLGVSLQLDLPHEAVVLWGIEERLAQVVVNLLDNALSFSPPGGLVRLWLRKGRDRVLIVVEDEGPGIPDEALEKIFARFYSDRPEGTQGQHSGLGLSISRQIVEAHEGVIWGENIKPNPADTGKALRSGARFVVSLPLERTGREKRNV